jgi:guanylate kinase
MIFVVCGPGGVGKGTLVKRVLELVGDVTLSRSWTTRSPRYGEDPGAYVFVGREDFEAKVRAGGFLEWTEFPGTGHLYGTPLPDSGVGERGDLLLEIELDGARQVRRDHPDAVVILVVAPSISVQEERLRGRGDDEQAVARRLEVGRFEEKLGRQLADHVVVNDDVERAAGELAGIIESYRKRMETT